MDDLNLKHGIVHQDVAARNLLVNPSTDAIMLFDVNYSGQIGGIGYSKTRDDIKAVIFTLYEVITHDTHFRDHDYDQQDPADVEGLEEWVQHPDVKLDHPVSEYRAVLKDWVQKRREGRQITVYTEAPEYTEWPDFPDPPPEKTEFSDGLGNSTFIEGIVLYKLRRYEREQGVTVLNWERPAQRKLANGSRVFANGQFACKTECTGSDEPNIS
jgi:hypothetical protein